MNFEEMYKKFIRGDLEEYKKWLHGLKKHNLILYGIYLNCHTEIKRPCEHFLRYAIG